jgi:hypothetical protein
MGLVHIWPLTYFEGEGSVEPRGPTGAREYAIAGTYEAFMHWRQADLPARRHVSYLTRERAEQLVAAGAPRGTLHRLDGWEGSPAREGAEWLDERLPPRVGSRRLDDGMGPRPPSDP